MLTLLEPLLRWKNHILPATWKLHPRDWPSLQVLRLPMSDYDPEFHIDHFIFLVL